MTEFGPADYFAVIATYSDKGGIELIAERDPAMPEDIRRVIAAMRADTFMTKFTKEHGSRQGRRLFAPIEMNRYLKARFGELGWKSRRQSFTSPEHPGASTQRGYRELDG